MRGIVDVRISPTEDVHVTMAELLEDFADSVASWQFLEDETMHYAHLKGGPACVIRCAAVPTGGAIDYAFATDPFAPEGGLRLLVVDAEDRTEGSDEELRNASIEYFIDAFSEYLGRRRHLAMLQVFEQEHS